MYSEKFPLEAYGQFIHIYILLLYLPFLAEAFVLFVHLKKKNFFVLVYVIFVQFCNKKLFEIIRIFW